MKRILISYLDRNKVVSIPPDSGDELEYLTEQFKKVFAFGDNVNFLITFQRFDSDWDEYIDVESPVVFNQKDRLKAVVTPILNDNSIRTTSVLPLLPSSVETDNSTSGCAGWSSSVTPTGGTSASDLLSDSDSNSDITPLLSQRLRQKDHSDMLDSDISTPLVSSQRSRCGQNTQLSTSGTDVIPLISPHQNAQPLHNHDDDDDDISVCTPKRPRQLLPLSDDDDNGQSSKSGSDCGSVASSVNQLTPQLSSKSLVKKGKRSADVPIPQPFPFPPNYRPDVEEGLRTGNMSRQAKSHFLTSIARTMFHYKKFPSSDDFTRVACEIIQKYPFLKTPCESPTKSIKESLVNRFKEFRRVPKERNKPKMDSSTAPSISGKRKAPERDLMKPPQLPLGEDKTSFERHNKLLLMEFKKPNPNPTVVSRYMQLTFAFRRADILANPYPVTTIFSKYPFLQEIDQLVLEMQRISDCEDLQSSARDRWINCWCPRIQDQVTIEKEKNKRLATIIKDLEISEGESSCITPIIFLVYMVPDPKAKPNHEKIIWAVPDDCDLEKVIEDKGQTEPYILLYGGTYIKPKQSFLVVDSQIVAEIQDCFSNFFSLCEYCVLNITAGTKLTPTVSHFLASLTK